MGIPLPDPHPPTPGPDCPVCTPNPFPSGTTPTVIRAVFGGMTTYAGWPPPPNGVPIHLSNDSLSPCLWEAELFYGGAIYDILYDAPISVVIISQTSPAAWQVFNGVLLPCDRGPFINTCIWPDSSPVGGSCQILDLPLDYIMLLAHDYNLLPDPRGLYDVVDSVAVDHKCVRLTGRTYPGSVLIDLDLAAI